MHLTLRSPLRYTFVPPASSAVEVSVSVLVPVLDEQATIRDAVAAMTAQELDGTIEFLFADGRSSDETRARLEQLAREDPRIRVLDNPLRGTASGLNVCLREARGTYVARMDAHALYPPNYVRTGIERLQVGDCAWVAGPQLAEPRGRVSAAVAAALESPLGRGGGRRWVGGGAGEEYELDTGVFCGVWRREDLLAHGGWDEGWPRNQDSELAARFLAAGQRIVCVPAMVAGYIPRDSLARLWRQYRDYGAYRAKTAGRHPASLRRSALLPPLVVLDAGAALLAPRPLRRLARAGLVVYGLALVQAAHTTGRGRRHRETAPFVPLVLATMHVAHGIGFFAGCRRWGVPWRALACALRGRGGVAGRYAGPVDAPSLRVGAAERD
jgi:glycosyltransferase involved in cell wall biosynthesis